MASAASPVNPSVSASMSAPSTPKSVRWAPDVLDVPVRVSRGAATAASVAKTAAAASHLAAPVITATALSPSAPPLSSSSSTSAASAASGVDGVDSTSEEPQVTASSFKATNWTDTVSGLFKFISDKVADHFGADDYIESPTGLQADVMMCLMGMSGACALAAVITAFFCPPVAIGLAAGAAMFLLVLPKVAEGFDDMRRHMNHDKRENEKLENEKAMQKKKEQKEIDAKKKAEEETAAKKAASAKESSASTPSSHIERKEKIDPSQDPSKLSIRLDEMVPEPEVKRASDEGIELIDDDQK